MRLSTAVITHPGKVREKNEDNFYFFGTTLNDIGKEQYYASKRIRKSNDLTLYAIFDGMGGMSAGDVASKIAASVAKTMCKDFENLRLDDALLLMNNICLQANAEICNEMLSNVRKRMGSTAAIICVKDDQYYLCNIGDSPIYIQRNKQLTRISFEHSEREMYEQINGPSDKGKKFKLTQHLGIFPEEMDIEPYLAFGQLFAGDKLLICSDGLTDMVDEDEINQILSNSKRVDTAVKRLAKRALGNGGRDNVTIVCIGAYKPDLRNIFK